MPKGTLDLFTPIHKGYRSMIYDLGARVQANDFADIAASTALLSDLQYQFGSGVSASCALCILHSHATHEEAMVFPAIAQLSSDLVTSYVKDHQAFTARLGEIAQRGRAIVSEPNAEERVRMGRRLNAELNEFFAAYLAHMNREEVELVPWMQERFTDAEMGAMTGRIIASIPLDRLAVMLRWILPAMDLEELTGMLAGVQRGAPPPILELVRATGSARVDSARWAHATGRIGF